MERCDSELRALLADDEADVMQRALDTLFTLWLAEMYRRSLANPRTPTLDLPRRK